MELDNWRQQSAKAAAKKVTEIYFSNSKNPNVFWIKNLSDADLYIATSFIPSAKSFHKRVLPFSDEIVATPRTTDRIFIYNNSNIDAQLDVYSDKIGIFDYMLLKKNTDCVIQGVKQDLTLSVSDTALKDVTHSTSGGNKLLKIYHSALDLLGGCFTGTSVRVTPIIANNLYIGTATDITTVGTNIYNIHLIANDGTDPVTISIDGKEFTLKGGETLNDIYKVLAKTVIIGKAGESINCRYICSS